MSEVGSLLRSMRAAAEAAQKLQARFLASGAEVIEILDLVDRLQGLTIDLLAESKKLKKDLKRTQYLSVLWVRILDSYVPPERRQEAMKALTVGIAEGMKQAEIEDDEHLGQLEQQTNSE